jgi:hypothetical protein
LRTSLRLIIRPPPLLADIVLAVVAWMQARFAG